MSTPVRVAGFAAGLLLVFGATFAIGGMVGSVAGPAPAHEDGHGSGSASGHGPHDEPAEAGRPTDVPGGLMVSQDGYGLTLTDQTTRPGRDVPVALTITGPDGRPVTAYDSVHERRLHLIAVRRDFTGFQHVHPVLGDDGVWRTRLDLTPGPWRVFADFRPSGAEGLTLGTDLAVGGRFAPQTQAAESRTARVGDYTVTLAGDLEPGSDSRLTLSVSRGGRPVTDLQPYLGAFGHLVALRGGDLAYLHVHPEGDPADGSTQPGPRVVFYAAVPSAGGYHLYLDFKHRGVVRTASFTLAAGDAEPAGADTAADGEHEQEQEHDHE